MVKRLDLGHNRVNKRLRHEETSSDPAWPKVPFPTKEQCPKCVLQVDENGDATDYDENETYNYLKDYYQLQPIAAKKSSGINQVSSSSFVFLSLIVSVLSSLLS